MWGTEEFKRRLEKEVAVDFVSVWTNMTVGDLH